MVFGDGRSRQDRDPPSDGAGEGQKPSLPSLRRDLEIVNKALSGLEVSTADEPKIIVTNSGLRIVIEPYSAEETGEGHALFSSKIAISAKSPGAETGEWISLEFSGIHLVSAQGNSIDPKFKKGIASFDSLQKDSNYTIAFR